MEKEQILMVVKREMCSLGEYYRNDWSDFDGRTLRNQLDILGGWATDAENGKTNEEFTAYSEMFEQQVG